MNPRHTSTLGASRLFYLALLLLGMSFTYNAHAQQQQGSRLLHNIPVTGTAGSAAFEGRLSITDLSLNQAGQLVADGILQGKVDGQQVRQAFTDIPLQLTEGGAQQVCDILFLDIGPIFLDLLGLQVELSQITLDINAVPGPGNLLGNLLCAVAGLLDGSFNLDAALQSILNNILAVINELL